MALAGTKPVPTPHNDLAWQTVVRSVAGLAVTSLCIEEQPLQRLLLAGRNSLFV